MSAISPSTPYAAGLSLVPTPVLARLVARLIHGMRRRHPRLVAAFARLEPAVVHVLPIDLPHRFALAFGGGRMDVRVLRAADPTEPDALIRGHLAALVDLLQGRIDGDSLFFSRDIEITGSMAVVVAVRNTLDREEIVIRDEIAALFGPLERPARRAGRRMEALVGRLEALHAGLHQGVGAPGLRAPERDLAAECDALRAEVQALKTRVARMDVRKLRSEAAVTGAP